MKLQKSQLAFVSVIAIVGLTFVAGLIDLLTNWDDDHWDRNSIETYLEIPLPVDADSVAFDGRQGRGGRLNLAFSASNESVDAFVSNFCDDTLYQGYDPFNSIDSEEQVDNGHLITVEPWITYYSYSPGTPDNQFGMRCVFSGKGQIQVLVDKAASDTASVRIEVLYQNTHPYR